MELHFTNLLIVVAVGAAIAVSGIAKGELVSLTLAPALLVVMCLVMAYDSPAGAASPDR
jgi:hypothetical protein